MTPMPSAVTPRMTPGAWAMLLVLSRLWGGPFFVVEAVGVAITGFGLPVVEGQPVGRLRATMRWTRAAKGV